MQSVVTSFQLVAALPERVREATSGIYFVDSPDPFLNLPSRLLFDHLSAVIAENGNYLRDGKYSFKIVE
jgi:hypothetical protein